MSKRGTNISLSSYDDIFETDRSRAEVNAEKVQQVPLIELYPFEKHPFKVQEDEEMQKMVESIQQFGVLTPAIARPRADGGFELVSGHRRHMACEIAGMESMPVIIRELDDDAATILMVDSNLQRENILPSERAKALKMKLEAIKHQGMKRSETSRQVVGKSEAADIIGEQTGESGRQVQRYIRLTELVPQILDMVDDKQIAFNPAVELSYLPKEKQEEFLEAMDYAQTTPSLSQAQRIKKLNQDGMCTMESMCAVMSEEKKSDLDKLTIKPEVLKKYFPKSYTPKQMEDTIIKLLDQWQKKRNRQMEH